MKRYIVLFILFILPSISFAASLEGTWIREFDKVLDGKITAPLTGQPLHFNTAKKHANIFHGRLLVKGDPGIYRGQIEEPNLGKNIAFIRVWSKSNQYRAYMTFTSVDNDHWMGTWRDNRGNMGDIKMYRQKNAKNVSKVKPATQPSTTRGGNAGVAVGGNSPVTGKYLRIEKGTFSTLKDGALKVHFNNLPGYYAQQICLYRPNGDVIRCSSFETSKKTSGDFDFYVPQPAGNYHILLHFCDDKITSYRERNKQLEMVRDRLEFMAIK